MISANALVLLTVLASTQTAELWEFTAPWCGSCREMEPTISRLKQEGIEVRQLSFDQNRELARQAQVSSLPAFLLVSDGQILERTEGRTSAEELRRMWLRHQSKSLPAAPRSEPATSVVRGQTGQSESRGMSKAWSALSDRWHRERGCQNCGSRSGCQCSAVGRPSPRQLAQFDGIPLESVVVENAPDGNPSNLAPGGLPPASNLIPAHDIPAASSMASRDVDNGITTRVTFANDAMVQRALAATVRLRVEDRNGISLGTGTIIDIHDDEALVLTCGHIFRDSDGKGVIKCDLFAGAGAANISGKLISFDQRRDVGLISMRPGIEVESVKVGGPGCVPQKQDPVFSVGCNRGQDPSLIRNEIRAINRYHGPANLVVGGRPVDGRSGGGLFDSQGRLIGVCNAADQEQNEGLYAALGPIRAELDAAGLSSVYRPNRASIAHAPKRIMPGKAGTTPGRRSGPRLETPLGNSTEAATGERSLLGVQAATSPLPPSTTDRVNGTEVICIVRSRQPGSERGQAFVLEQPSEALLHQLSQEMSRRGSHVPTQWHHPTDGRRVPPQSAAEQWQSLTQHGLR